MKPNVNPNLFPNQQPRILPCAHIKPVVEIGKKTHEK
jgi:hypothetical protein